MGSNENPPKDIQLHQFFQGIDWEAIHDRRCDGPWIPDAIPYGHNKRQSTKITNSTTTTNVNNNGELVSKDELSSMNSLHRNIERDGTGLKVDHIIDINGREASLTGSTSIDLNADGTMKPHDLSSRDNNTTTNDEDSLKHQNHYDNNNQTNNENSIATMDDRPSELLQLRDSIIAFSKGYQPNRIPEWSFFDEKILLAAIKEDPININNINVSPIVNPNVTVSVNVNGNESIGKQPESIKVFTTNT